LPLRHEAAPDCRQARQRRLAVAVELQIALGAHRIEWMLDAGKVAVQVCEAAVLGVDHHDLLDLIVQRGVEPQVGGTARRRAARGTLLGRATGQRESDTDRGEPGQDTAALGIVGGIVGVRRQVGVVVCHRSVSKLA